MPKVTAATVNKALKAKGISERITRGIDYYYFYAGEAHTWKSQCVMVPKASALTIEQWLEEHKELSQHKNGGN